jgi:hypothetical protein
MFIDAYTGKYLKDNRKDKFFRLQGQVDIVRRLLQFGYSLDRREGDVFNVIPIVLMKCQVILLVFFRN